MSSPNKVFREHLGMNGTMISGSRTGYRDRNPLNVPVFNANVVIESNGILETAWNGDIDLTLSEETIKTIAISINKKIWILPESAGGWNQKNNIPDILQFVYSTDGVLSEFGDTYYRRDSITRDEQGKLIKKPVKQKS